MWDLRTGKKLRGFAGAGQTTWPAFLWSSFQFHVSSITYEPGHDDKYIARLGVDMISVYEVPSMNLLDSKSLKIPGFALFCAFSHLNSFQGVKEIAWSPKDNILSYWTPESGNAPAAVVLLEIPSKKEKRKQTLFNVADVKMYWQSKGDCLAVKVTFLPSYQVVEFISL